jgi:hypothetical protein
MRAGFINNLQGAYTHLEAKILQEDGMYTVTVRLDNRGKSDSARGAHHVPTFEEASSLIGALARKFDILQDEISLDIEMENLRDSTRH